MTDPTIPPRPRRLRRCFRTTGKLALALGLGVFLAELALRFLLFSEHPAIVRRTHALRQSANFADRRYDEEIWKLLYEFDAATRKHDNARFDPVVGWVRPEVTPLTYVHAGAAEIGRRRPVLLFGDSFANCVTGASDCWEGLLASSPLASDFAVLNYGTWGYGFDQIVLSMIRALPLYAEERPVVVVSLLVDSDLERSTLRCRDSPKPHFHFDANRELELDGSVPASEAEFLELHPVEIRSYLWRYLLYGSGLTPRSWARWWSKEEEHDEASRELNAALFEMAVRELQARGVEYFFLLFHSSAAFGRSWSASWEEPFVIETLDRLGAPYVLSRPILRRAALEQSCSEERFFLAEGEGRNHLSAEGNAILFEAFERGLQRSFDDVSALRILGWDTLVPRSGARWIPATDGTGPARLDLDLPAGGSMSATYTLAERATRLSMGLRIESSPPGRAHVAISLDGEIVREVALRAGAEERALDLDLSARETLRINVKSSREGPIRLSLLAPRIEGVLPGSREW